jgi:DNA-binding NarL/FixJ family response regulator
MARHTRHSSEVRTRVTIIEENHVEREYLQALVGAASGVTVSAVHEGINGVLPKLRKDLPDVLLIDIAASGKAQAEWLRRVHNELPHTSVLVLSSKRGGQEFLHTLEAGISGWLDKPCAADQIVRAILILKEGGAVLCSQAARRLLDHFDARGTLLDTMTGREREVMLLLSEGRLSEDIAARLGVAKATLRTHIKNILEKLKVGSRAEALAKYLNPRAVQPMAEAVEEEEPAPDGQEREIEDDSRQPETSSKRSRRSTIRLPAQ